MERAEQVLKGGERRSTYIIEQALPVVLRRHEGPVARAVVRVANLDAETE